MTGFVLFTIGILIVLRARIYELTIFLLLLVPPMIIIMTILLRHLIDNYIHIDLSDFFLLVVECLLILIILNLLLFIQSLKKLQQTSNRTAYYFPENESITADL